ncbi:MAG: hypothetical protein KGZ97_10960 [Bacteroidetes bacterium]|nr:hypothetical protein [Bacteroidota bacterium]
MQIQRFTIAILILLFSHQVFSQFYIKGQDPGGLKWKQIKNKNFKIVFPEEYEENALYIADILNYAYDIASESLEHKPRRITVIVHNQTVISNGFVAWAPRRMELFTTPPQNNDAHDWMESLAVHEFRHVVQVDKLNQGLTKILSWLLGEQAVGAVLGMYIPYWFLEGDAVVAETALTNSGRGRLPVFEQGLRAQVLSKRIYSFDKAMYGSFKDYVPNHYELGYNLVAYARIEYGANVWSPVLNQVAKHPYSVVPFTWGIKKATGSNSNMLYSNTMNYLAEEWNKQLENTNISKVIHTAPKNKLYTDYKNIFYLDETSVIAYKSGLEDIGSVVIIDKLGNEKKLFIAGRVFPNSFNYNAGKLVWNEFRRDPRWNHRSYSEIFIFDFKKGKKEKLTHGTKLFSPALSYDGKLIAAIEVDEKSKVSIVIIDANTGEEIKRINNSNNDFLMSPAWNNIGNKILVVALDNRGKRIDVVDVGLGNFSTVLNPSHTEISKPIFWEDLIVFNGAFSGVDNIYLLDPKSKIVSQLVSTAYGGIDFSVSPSGMKFVFSDYTADGYKPAFGNIADMKILPLEGVENLSVNFADKLAKQEKGVVSSETIIRKEHDVRKYSKLLNLFKPHSWAPVVVDAARQKIKPGASILFQNDLSTSFVFAGYEYDLNEKSGKYFVDYSYHGLYPVISAYYDYGRREQPIMDVNFAYTEQSKVFRSYVPFSFSKGHYFYGITPIAAYRNISFSPDRDTILNSTETRYVLLENQSIHSLEYRLHSYLYRASVKRDMNPRLGQVLDISFRHSPFLGYNLGETIGIRSSTYLPGIMKHHSLLVTMGYQTMTAGNSYYNYQSFLNYPRGITMQKHKELQTLYLDYSYPIAYPDWGINSMFYLQRISANMFFDYAIGIKEVPNESEILIENQEEFMTCGIDLMLDVNFFRTVNLSKFGPRIGYNLKTEKPFLDVVFKINF